VKILVTGGTGFLGKELVQRLMKEGHQLRLLARKKPTGLTDGAEWRAGDLTDGASLKAAVKDVEAVYHLAGRVSFSPEDSHEMFALHVEGTRRLMDALKDVPLKRFVLASTSGTTAVSKEERVATEADEAPITVIGRWPYYASKLYEEQLVLASCRKRGTPLVILNPSLLLGPGDERLSSGWVVAKFLSRDIPAMPNGGISFVDVRDAAQAFVQALTRGDLYGKHLMGVNMSFTEFFARLERITGIPAPRMKLPSRLNVLGGQALERFAKWRKAEPALEAASIEIAEHYFYLDSSKAQAQLGFVARDPQETLFDTVRDLSARMPSSRRPAAFS